MLRPQYYDAKITQKTQMTPKVTKQVLECVNPPTIDFIPGQFVNLKCPNGKYRSYSIASDPKITDQISLLIETAHEGLASNYVRSLNVNDKINMIGASGRFKLTLPTSDHLVFFATGTGIAAFIPMFFELKSQQYKGNISLYYGVRSVNEILEHDLLNTFQLSLANMQINYFISRPPEDSPLLRAPFYAGRVTSVLTANLDKTAEYYICGHPKMVDEVVDYLHTIDISDTQINSEGFTHSG